MSYQQYPAPGYDNVYAAPMREPLGTNDPEDMSLPLYGASFKQAIKRYFRGYVKFDGRASRSEYWFAQLAILIFTLIPLAIAIVGLIMAISGGVGMASSYNSEYDDFSSDALAGGGAAASSAGMVLYFVGLALLALLGLGLFLPSIAIAWRRLHDANFAGPMYFLSFIPYVGGIILLIFCCMPSRVEGERFDQRAGGYPQAGYGAPQYVTPSQFQQPGAYEQPQQPQYSQQPQQPLPPQPQPPQQGNYTQNPYGQNPYGQAPNGPANYGQNPVGQQPHDPNSANQSGYAQGQQYQQPYSNPGQQAAPQQPNVPKGFGSNGETPDGDDQR